MNKLSDEILNKYVDGELDYTSLLYVKEILSTSIKDKKRYQALLAVHNELKKLKAESPKDSFTISVMNKLVSRKKAYKEQRNFVLVVSSLFIFFIFVVVGMIVYYAVSSPSSQQTSPNYSQILTSTLRTIASSIVHIFSPKGISIFGSILSLGILISGYFFFENIKSPRLKNNNID